jgi:hypothetical protein
LVYQSSIGNRPSPIISLDPDDPHGKYHTQTENQS